MAAKEVHVHYHKTKDLGPLGALRAAQAAKSSAEQLIRHLDQVIASGSPSSVAAAADRAINQLDTLSTRMSQFEQAMGDLG